MEQKQTAVEWLVSQIQNMKIGNNQLLITDEDLNYLLNQAKEMEKKQIIETARFYFHERGKATPEQYYIKEYGK